MIKGITQVVMCAGLAFATPALSETGAETAQAAHSAYLAAINSNNLDRFLETVTEDVVFIAPGSPAMEGKAEVARWVGGYFEAIDTSWEKQSLEFVVASDWAFERYAFTATDRPYGSNTTTVATGHGINIYHREKDGTWRVARDIWSNASTDAQTASLALSATCSNGIGPC